MDKLVVKNFAVIALRWFLVAAYVLFLGGTVPIEDKRAITGDINEDPSLPAFTRHAA